jgi:hypothetical protein
MCCGVLFVSERFALLYEVYFQDCTSAFEVPGITGLWRVTTGSFDEMVRMDLDYIEHQSLWLDNKLLMQTPAAVFSARGAGKTRGFSLLSPIPCPSKYPLTYKGGFLPL